MLKEIVQSPSQEDFEKRLARCVSEMVRLFEVQICEIICILGDIKIIPDVHGRMRDGSDEE